MHVLVACVLPVNQCGVRIPMSAGGGAGENRRVGGMRVEVFCSVLVSVNQLLLVCILALVMALQ